MKKKENIPNNRSELNLIKGSGLDFIILPFLKSLYHKNKIYILNHKRIPVIEVRISAGNTLKVSKQDCFQLIKLLRTLYPDCFDYNHYGLLVKNLPDELLEVIENDKGGRNN